mgnify:CR=1 FL=1
MNNQSLQCRGMSLQIQSHQYKGKRENSKSPIPVHGRNRENSRFLVQGETEKKQIVSKCLYHLSGSTYTTYLAEDVLKASDKSLLIQLYAWLKQHVDTATDPIGNPNMGRGIDWTKATDV